MNSSGPNGTGLRRIFNAARCSLAGLRGAWRTQPAFRQEAWLAAALAPVALWLGRSVAERGLLLAVLLLVLVVELLNTGIEAVVDRIGPEHHELSGLAKDAGSAAVLLALLVVALVWGSIAWERFAQGAA